MLSPILVAVAVAFTAGGVSTVAFAADDTESCAKAEVLLDAARSDSRAGRWPAAGSAARSAASRLDVCATEAEGEEYVRILLSDAGAHLILGFSMVKAGGSRENAEIRRAFSIYRYVSQSGDATRAQRILADKKATAMLEISQSLSRMVSFADVPQQVQVITVTPSPLSTRDDHPSQPTSHGSTGASRPAGLHGSRSAPSSTDTNGLTGKSGVAESNSAGVYSSSGTNEETVSWLTENIPQLAQSTRSDGMRIGWRDFSVRNCRMQVSRVETEGGQVHIVAITLPVGRVDRVEVITSPQLTTVSGLPKAVPFSVHIWMEAPELVHTESVGPVGTRDYGSFGIFFDSESSANRIAAALRRVVTQCHGTP